MPTSTTTSSTRSSPSTTEKIADRASGAAEVAVDEGKDVARSAASHAASLAERARHELEGQSREQGTRAAELLRGVCHDLDVMGEASTGESPAGDVALSLSSFARRWADRLDRDGLGAVATEIGNQGRRRPVRFLAISLAAGFAAGRLVRNVDTSRIADAVRDDGGHPTTAPESQGAGGDPASLAAGTTPLPTNPPAPGTSGLGPTGPGMTGDPGGPR